MPGNTHRAGVLRANGSPKLIASGSEEFCQTAASRYREQHPDREVIIIARKSEGVPRDWNREED